jgi:tetratricopeptide (TPR) repeat protein
MELAIIGAIIVAIITASATIVAARINANAQLKKKDADNQPQPEQMPPNSSQDPTAKVDSVAITIKRLDNLPYENSFFTGRTGKLEAISQNFKAKKRVYIRGAGGIGKSAVALEYARSHKQEDYDVIWWINAADQTEVQRGFKEFAIRLKLVNLYKQPDDEIILRIVQEWLDDNSRWLFIYDNADVEDVSKWLGQYLPHSNTGNVIVTTTSSVFSAYEEIELMTFEESEALDFLIKRTKKNDEKTKALAECLGYFPLALEQAGAYLCTTRMTYEKYIAKYEEKLEHVKNLTHYDKSIYATLQISIDKLEKNGAEQMLNLCAYFAPDRIPISLFDESKVFPETLKVNTDIHDMVGELAKYSLLNYDKDDFNLFYVHRLLQKTVQRKHKEDTQWLSRCLDMVCGVFGYEFGDTSSMDAFVQNVSHVLKIAQYAERTFANDEGAQKKIAWLYSEAGEGFNCGGQYNEAVELYKKALDIRERVLGKDHQDTATTYNNIASVYDNQGKYEQALELCKKALDIRERGLGKNHPGTAATYNNIALVYSNQGKYEQALGWYEKA